MPQLDEFLQHLEELVEEIDRLEDPARSDVFDLLDGIDALHRTAVTRLADGVGRDTLEPLKSDPAIAWLLDAYGVGVDEKEEVERALDDVLPYIHSHGGKLEVLDARGGVVRVRMSGSCSGCNASAITLTEGIERALRDNWPRFAALEVEEEPGESHDPPGPTLVEIQGFARDR